MAFQNGCGILNDSVITNTASNREGAMPETRHPTPKPTNEITDDEQATANEEEGTLVLDEEEEMDEEEFEEELIIEDFTIDGICGVY
jgi:mycofactocin precursor